MFMDCMQHQWQGKLPRIQVWGPPYAASIFLLLRNIDGERKQLATRGAIEYTEQFIHSTGIPGAMKIQILNGRKRGVWWDGEPYHRGGKTLLSSPPGFELRKVPGFVPHNGPTGFVVVNQLLMNGVR